MRHPIRFGTLTAVLVTIGAGPLMQPVFAQPGNGYRLTVDRKLLGSACQQRAPGHRSAPADLAQLYRHFSVKPYWVRQDQANGQAKPASKSTTGEGSSKP